MSDVASAERRCIVEREPREAQGLEVAEVSEDRGEVRLDQRYFTEDAAIAIAAAAAIMGSVGVKKIEVVAWRHSDGRSELDDVQLLDVEPQHGRAL